MKMELMTDGDKIMDEILDTIYNTTLLVGHCNTYQRDMFNARITKDMSEAYLNLMQAKSLMFSMTGFIELKKEGGTTCKGPYT